MNYYSTLLDNNHPSPLQLPTYSDEHIKSFQFEKKFTTLIWGHFGMIAKYYEQFVPFIVFLQMVWETYFFFYSLLAHCNIVS